MKDDFYFENENAENNPPVSFEKGKEEIEIEIDFLEDEKFESANESVNKVDNVINSQNATDNKENPQNQPASQPNYYGYQHSYQPFYSKEYHITEQTRLKCEKIEVKRTANYIGIGLLLFFAFEFVFSFILATVKRSKIVLEFIKNPAIILELNIIITILGFSLSALFILMAQGKKVGTLISYGKPKKGLVLPAVLASVGFCFTANIATSLLRSKFQSILPFAEPQTAFPNGILGFILSVLAIAATPALIEEFLFRGVIMGSLLKYGKAFAIFTSATVFSLIHGNLVQIPFAFLVGLVLGAMVVQTDSIWTGVIIHFINNFISVCISYLGTFIDENLLMIFSLFLFALLITSGIFATFVLSKKSKNMFHFEKSDQISSSIKKFGYFSTSLSIIFFFIIVALEILSYQLMLGLV